MFDTLTNTTNAKRSVTIELPFMSFVLWFLFVVGFICVRLVNASGPIE